MFDIIQNNIVLRLIAQYLPIVKEILHDTFKIRSALKFTDNLIAMLNVN